jgi:hypothetical protein
MNSHTSSEPPVAQDVRPADAAEHVATSPWLPASLGRAGQVLGRHVVEPHFLPPAGQTVETHPLQTEAQVVKAPAAPAPRGDDEAPEVTPSAPAQERRERATRAYFSKLYDEPLASIATAETLALFGEVASQLPNSDDEMADRRLLEIARATAARHSHDILHGPGTEPPAVE